MPDFLMLFSDGWFLSKLGKKFWNALRVKDGFAPKTYLKFLSDNTKEIKRIVSANRNGAANIIRCASGRVFGFQADSMAPTSAVTGNRSIRTYFYLSV